MMMFPMMVVLLPVSLTLDILAIKGGFGTEGVACATSFTLLLQFLSLFWIASRSLYHFKEGLLLLGSILLRFAGMLGALILLDRLIRFEPLVVRTVCQLLIFLLGSLPFVIALAKRFEIFSQLRTLPARSEGSLGT